MIRMYTKIKDKITKKVNGIATEELCDVSIETADILNKSLEKYNDYFFKRLNSYGTIDVGLVNVKIEDGMLVTSCCPRQMSSAKEVAECMTQVLKETNTKKIIHENSEWDYITDDFESVSHKVVLNPCVSKVKVSIA